MEKRILKIAISGLILGVLVFASCRKLDTFDDLKVVNYDAEFAIPLFTAKTSFQDILNKFDEDTYVQIGPDDLITLYYKGDVAGRSSTDIFAALGPYFGLPLPIFDTISTIVPDSSLPSSLDVDYAILKSGTFDYLFRDTIHEAGITDLIVTLPGVTYNGTPFTHTKTYTTSVDNDFINFGVGPFDLTGYKITPVNNNIEIHYHAYRQNSNSYDTLDIFAIKIDNFQTSYVEGYLGNDIYELEPDSIVIDFFNNWTRGDIYFADPKINLIVKNSFGFPVRSKAQVLEVLTVDGDIIPITSESGQLDSIVVDYPSLSEVGETKYTYFDFNKDNTNIDEVLGAGPVAIYYDFDAVANPDNNAAIRGFMTDSSEMTVQVEVELPMYGTASGFEARDTFGINFETYENYDDVEFKIISENGIPLDVGIQIFFADVNGTVLDSLFTPNVVLLEAAPVDGAGLPTAISEKTTFTTFEGVRFDKIKSAKQLFMRSSFSTVNNGETIVKILSTQEVKIRMGMKIGVSG